MNNLLTLTTEQTMTSKEVVDTINSLRTEDEPVLRHTDFMRKCTRITEELGQRTPAQSLYINSQNKTQPCYLLDKELSIILVATESARVMQAIVRRWQELESKQAKLLPQTHIQAVEAYLVTLKQVEAQQLQLGMQAEQIDEDAILTEKSAIYYTVKQLRELVSKPSGKVLSRVSDAMGYEVKSVFSQYEQLAYNQYHRDVVNAVYGTDL